MNENVNFMTYLDPKLPEEMDNDEERLMRILLNLLLNSQKYTTSGYIRLSIRFLNINCSITDSDHSPTKSYVKFEVSDTGVGISEEKIPYIFNLIETD